MPPRENDAQVLVGELEYVGFWSRLVAFLIDGLLILAVTWLPLTWYYGESYWLSDQIYLGMFDFVVSTILPGVAIILFWIVKQATPGKMAISSKVVDADSGCAPSAKQCIIRYLSYYLGFLSLGVGFLWIALDSQKQGWHDKIARTVVVRPKNREAKPPSIVWVETREQ
jgi:uncharacterized RDD family membrane protein YckC